MPYVMISLNVKNSSDNSPVVGAKVFIDGTINFDPTQFSVVTDSNGNAQFQVIQNLGNHNMQITADGFMPGGSLISTLTTLPQSFAIKLTPNPPVASPVNLQFVPSVAGIMWSILTGITPVSSGVSTPDGSSASVAPVPNGTYNFSATLQGYAPLATTIVVNGQADPYTFTLVANADSGTTQLGNTNGSSVPLTTQPDNIISQVSTVPPAATEYIYPNTDYDKYFTITGARIYVGNLFIDEINTIQYALQDNAIPIYGYASRFVDAYGQGRSLVQGQLTLNFVTEGYLYTVLQEYKKYLSATQGNGFPIGTPQVDVVAQALGLMATRDSLLQQANNNQNDTGSAIQAGVLQGKLTSLLNSFTPDQIDSLTNQRQQQLQTFNDVVAFDNAVYQDVLFDIRVELGNEATGVKRVRYLEKCKLISNEQVIAPDGQVLLDSYGFIARRLR